jgi:hypothetical protein
MDFTKKQFTKEIPLPSEGFFYPEGHPLKDGLIELRYMTAADEDILTDKTLAKKGKTFDRLMERVIVTDVSPDEILSGDKAAIIIATRVLAYGQKYRFTARSAQTDDKREVEIDLTEIDPVKPDFSELEPGQQEFEFRLPVMDIPVTFRLLTHKDDREMRFELKRQEESAQVTTRLARHITSVDGERSQTQINVFVRKHMLARDSQALRDRIREVSPDMDLNFEFENSDGEVERLPIRMEADFFFPSTSGTS